MSRPRTRQPRELLARISTTLFGTIASVSVTPRKGDPLWRDAAQWAFDDVCRLVDELPPDPPKRSYYGSKGSLRNPHR